MSSTNANLAARRLAAVPRGVATAYPMFADRAENAELWDVEGRRFIDLSSFLLPAKGRYGLRDYEKMFCPDFKGGNDIFNMRGTDREHGCVVVVRPDQYVAHVLPLAAYAKLEAFFGDFMLSP